MRIFYDTEFHEDGHTIDFISIGMVRDDNAVYYAVSAEADYKRAAANPWLRQNVLCYLPMLTETEIDVNNETVKSRALIRDEVGRFVLGVDDPQLWAWYAAYDHVVLTQLFGRMIDLPTGFPQRTNDLRQEVHRLGNPQLPEQALKEHHALADAQQVKLWAGQLGCCLGDDCGDVIPASQAVLDAAALLNHPERDELLHVEAAASVDIDNDPRGAHTRKPPRAS